MTSFPIRITHISAVLISLQAIILSCGNRLPPPGGPEDKESPVVLETTPAQTEVGVDTGTRVIILFDEDLDKESAEKAIKFSPAHENLKMKVKGDRVELWPEGGMFPNTTYQVTVGSSLRDPRGNSFTGPFTLYFSTGDSMDTGLIRGEVRYHGRKAGGALVFASALPESISYYVQADTSGKYKLAQLPEKPFHLFSFLDQNGDGNYRFAVEPMDEKYVDLLTESVKVDFDLVVIDTSPPVLESVEPLDPMVIRLVFDDPMEIDPVTASRENFRIYPEKDSTAVIHFVSIEPDTSAVEVILLKIDTPLNEGERYMIELSGMRNVRGLQGRDPDNRQKFTYYGK